MALHQKPPKKDRRPWAALLLVFVVGVGWCSAEEEDQPPPAPQPVAAIESPPPEEQPAPPVPMEPPLPDASVAADAGVAPVVLATRKEPDLEDYMRRWREALAPLFRVARKHPGTPTLLKATPREFIAEAPDAGLEPCQPKTQRLEFTARHRFDLVVVVDTSGSMYRALPKIVRWLAELEQQIVANKSDTQLLVLADQQSLGRAKADGGINWRVGSTDALEVLLRAGRDRWTDALRGGADLQIVVVTDDESTVGKPTEYVARLTETLGGARFTFHVLGGFETTDQRMLAADEGVALQTCMGDGLIGLAPGDVYQVISRLTNGWRAPLCHEAARRQLSEKLLEMPSQTASCGWILDEKRHRIDMVSAVGPRLSSDRLLQERVQSNCAGMRRSYRMADSLLVLCQDSCEALKHDGYEALEVKLECTE